MNNPKIASTISSKVKLRMKLKGAASDWPGLGTAQYAACLLLMFMPIAGLGATPALGKSCDARKVFEKADRLLKAQQFNEAKAELTRLQGCAGMSPLETFNLGWFYGRAHEFKTALSIFQFVAPDVPDHLTHQYAIALTQFELADYRDSIETLKGVQAEGLLDAKSADLLGVSYSKLGLYQEAYPILAANIKQNPSDLLAYLDLVTLFVDSSNYEKAADIANQAAAAFPQVSEVFVVLGATDTLLGKLDKAHGDFATAAQLSPRDGEPRFFMALSDYKQGNFSKAIAELRSAIAEGIVDSDLHYLLAECLLKTDQAKSTDVLLELDRAIEIDPKSVPARALRGKVLLEAGHPEQAVADLKVAYEVDPSSHSAVYSLARAYSALGKKKEAAALFDQLNAQMKRDLADQHNMEIVDQLSEQRLKKVLSGGGAQ